MIRRALKIILTLSLLGVILAGLLFSGYAVTASAPGWLRMVCVEIQAACRDAGTQWMVVVCLVSYFVVFLFLAKRQTISTPHPGPLPVRGGEGGAFAFRAFFRGKWADPDFWLMGFVALVLLRYAFDYSNAAKSLQVVVLLTGIVIGKGVALRAGASRGFKFQVSSSKLEEAEPPSTIHSQLSTTNKARAVLSILVLLLAASALYQLERLIEFQYRAQRRWTGVWDNPNIYGVLMGVGAVLAMGSFVQRLTSKGQSRIQRKRHLTPALSPDEAERVEGLPTFNFQRSTLNAAHWFCLTFYLCAAALCAYGLLKSYSRGAWLGTAVGLGWLIVSWVWRLGSEGLVSKSEIGNQKSEIVLFRRSWFPSSILILSILVICFWQFRHTESPLARRVFSVGNPNDFSWRNRVTAWQGAGRMMLDKPVVGFGWGKAEEIYGKDYRAARLEETAAVQLNDYLMIGISAGVPALVCLLIYLWRSWSGVRQWAIGDRTEANGLSTINSQLSTIAASGAIVLLIGFWFDGGLFKLPTGVVFWVLVELSSCRSRGAETQTNPVLAGLIGDSSRRHLQLTRWQIALRWVAGLFALGALGLSALHLGTPQLAVTERTLSIARKFLVPPKEQLDFEFLAAKPIWSGQSLQTLLQHAHLANYNRSLVNWKLEEQLYREFVLAPEIDAAFDGEMDWRRPLWENFYPRIRKEGGLEAAAEIVGRHLRERVAVVENGKAINSKFEIQNSKWREGRSIAEIWQRGQADSRGFEIISVAALRSAGIPARLSASGQAEFWTGAEWKPASHPVTIKGGS